MTHSRDERLALADLLAEVGPDAPTLCEGWTTGDLAAHLVLRESRPDTAAGAMGGPLAGYTARALEKLKGRQGYAELIEAFRNGPPRFSLFALPRVDELGNTVEYFVHHEDVRRAAGDWSPRQLDPGLSDALWRQLKGGARLMLGRAPVGVELARDESMADLATAAASPGAGAGATARSDRADRDGAGSDRAGSDRAGYGEASTAQASTAQASAAEGGATTGGTTTGGATTSEATTAGPDPAGAPTAGASGSAGAGATSTGMRAGGPYRVTARRSAPLVTVTGTSAELTLWAFGRASASNVRLDGPKAAINNLQAWRR